MVPVNNSTLKVRSKSAAARIDMTLARQSWTRRLPHLPGRAIFSREGRPTNQDEGAISWYALDVVQETLKEIAGKLIREGLSLSIGRYGGVPHSRIERGGLSRRCPCG